MGTGIVSLKFLKISISSLYVSHFFRQQQTARWIWSSFECWELKYSTGWESSPAAEETNVEDDLKPFYNICNHCQIKDAIKHCPWTLNQIDHLYSNRFLFVLRYINYSSGEVACSCCCFHRQLLIATFLQITINLIQCCFTRMLIAGLSVYLLFIKWQLALHLS